MGVDGERWMEGSRRRWEDGRSRMGGGGLNVKGVGRGRRRWEEAEGGGEGRRWSEKVNGRRSREKEDGSIDGRWREEAGDSDWTA